jgi:hypothetical protein
VSYKGDDYLSNHQLAKKELNSMDLSNKLGVIVDGHETKLNSLYKF